MAVVSVKELFRKNVYEVAKPRQLTREFVVVLSDDSVFSPSSESDVFNTGLIPDIGHLHPTYGTVQTGIYKVRKITYTEGHDGSPYHVHVSVEYDIVLANELLSPDLRAATWEFVSAPGEVPALYYYDGSGNTTMRPLTNSAYDYFSGLVTQEATIVARVQKNFSSLPTDWIGSQNHVNNAVYLGCNAHTWKVNSVEVQQTAEQGSAPYWHATAELHFRQSGHNYQLPDVGFNFLSGGQKRRCMVFDFENGEWIPSPNPVGLNGSGAQTGGAPSILNRRVNPEINFQSLFGTPPTTPLGV